MRWLRRWVLRRRAPQPRLCVCLPSLRVPDMARPGWCYGCLGYLPDPELFDVEVS